MKHTIIYETTLYYTKFWYFAVTQLLKQNGTVYKQNRWIVTNLFYVV